MKKHIKKVLLVLFIVSILMGCSCGYPIDEDLLLEEESIVFDVLSSNFNPSTYRLLTKAINRRKELPERPFSDIIPVVHIVEEDLVAFNNKKPVTNHSTIRDILRGPNYYYLFPPKDGDILVDNTTIRIEEQKPLKEVVDQKYLDIERIKSLLTESEGCSGSKRLMQERFRKNHTLTAQDEYDILAEIRYCKTVELMNEVK